MQRKAVILDLHRIQTEGDDSSEEPAEMTMGTEVPIGCLGLQGFSGPGIGLRRPVRNAHRWRLWNLLHLRRSPDGLPAPLCTPCRNRYTPTLARRMSRCAEVEVRGFEPLSRTPPDCRDNNHVSDMERQWPFSRARGTPRVEANFAMGKDRSRRIEASGVNHCAPG